MKTVRFGNYWQSNNEEKEPIDWIVLKEETDKMYVLSKYCLDYVPYSDGHNLAWRNSLMRKWLNEDFINNAFSNEEQKKIILSDIRTESGGWYGPYLDSGNAVKDKVFIPSIAEAILYFGSTNWHDIDAEQKRITGPTNYAYDKGCRVYPLRWTSCWYLRTSGNNIIHVTANGEIRDSSAKNFKGTAVRPAMWIKK